MGIRNQKVGNVLILMRFRNGLPRRPVGPPRNDRLFRQSHCQTPLITSSMILLLDRLSGGLFSPLPAYTLYTAQMISRMFHVKHGCFL